MGERRRLRYDTALNWVRGVGERRHRDLRREGIERVEDLLRYDPDGQERETVPTDAQDEDAGS